MQKEEEEDVERHTNVGEVVYKLAFVPAAHTSQTLVSVQQPTQSDPWRSFLVRRVTRFVDQKCQFWKNNNREKYEKWKNKEILNTVFCVFSFNDFFGKIF